MKRKEDLHRRHVNLDFWAPSLGIFLGSYLYVLAYLALMVDVTRHCQEDHSTDRPGEGGDGVTLSQTLHGRAAQPDLAPGQLLAH